jgi:hypothetical protein
VGIEADMRRSALLLAAALVVTACGGGGDGKPASSRSSTATTSRPTPPRPRLEMTVSRGLMLVRGARATVSGGITGASRRAGVAVVVEADPWPNDGRFVAVRRLHTRSDGRFVLHVAPDRITTYRARSGRLQSPRTTIQVAPNPRVSLSVLGHTALATVRIRLPTGAPLARVRVHLYVARTSRASLRHVGSGKLARVGKSATADISYPEPRPGGRRFVRVCAAKAISPAYAEDSIGGQCGDASRIDPDR